MYCEEDFPIPTPSRIENGNIPKQISPIELPYMIYVVFNHELYLTCLPKSATIEDVKIHIVNVTGVSPTHPNIKFLKIEGYEFKNTCKLSSIDFKSPTVLYLEDYNTKSLQEEQNLQYNFFVVWNYKLVTVSIDKMSSMTALISKIVKATGIPSNHPSLKNISIGGNTPDIDSELLSLNLSKNSTIFLANIEVPESKVKEISLFIHFNLKLFVIIMYNNGTVERLLMEVSKATGLTNGHPVLQNMSINGNLLRNFIFISDLQLSMETHVYLENTPLYFTADHPLTSEPYIFVTIIFDKIYEIIVPNYITIGLLKQTIVYYTGMRAANRWLVNLSIEGSLAVNDYFVLSEFTSNSAFTINLNETLLNLTRSSHTSKSQEWNPPIEFTIISKGKPYRIIMERNKMIKDLIEEMYRTIEIPLLTSEMNKLTINGIVKYKDEALSTIPNDFVTILLDQTANEACTSTTQLRIPARIKICIIFEKIQHIKSVSEDRPVQYLLNYMIRILKIPSNHRFFKNLIFDGKQASKHSIISELNLKNYTVLDLDAVENAKKKEYAFICDEMYRIHEKIKTLAKSYEPINLHNLNPKKKLLVLDLDQTLIDYPSKGILTGNDLRPHLFNFLTTMYKYYNLIVWSATDMKSIVNKLEKLSLDKHEGFKFAALVDYKAMTSVNITNTKRRTIKPLMLIWKIFKDYNEKNTIMLDDISINFILNPRNGIVVTPYFAENFTTDNELEKLQNYLKNIAIISEDFTQIQLQDWETSDLR